MRKRTKSRLSYAEQIQQAFRKACRKRTQAQTYANEITPEMLFYQQAADCSACVSWEVFKGSWAGQNWLRKHFGCLTFNQITSARIPT